MNENEESPRPAAGASPDKPKMLGAIHFANLAAEEREAAQRYAAMVNAPLTQEAIDHLNRKILDGTISRRTVRRREAESGYCQHCGRGDCAPTADEYMALRQRTEKLENLAARVRELHCEVSWGKSYPSICAECSAWDGSTGCDNRPVDYPCATVQALTEGETS